VKGVGSTEGLATPSQGQLIAGQVIGRYRIISELGAGGMGEVFEAENIATGERVALRVPHRRDARSTARTLREARIAAAISNPHIARVIDADVDPNGLPFIVMERLHGETLAQRLQRVHRVPWRAAIEHLASACEGLEALHAAGLVHRDIKPSNLFLVREPDGTETTKIIDFGLSKPIRDDEQLTTSGVGFLGSIAYSAPELLQAVAHEPDELTDLWSLGVTLFQLVTGELPFAAGSPSAILANILTGAPRHASDLITDLPPELLHLIDATLNERASRPPTARPFRERLLECRTPVDATVFASGPSFVIRVVGRVFIMIWRKMPNVADVILSLKAAKEARERAGRKMIQLVVVPRDREDWRIDLRVGTLMNSRFYEMSENFDLMRMILEGDSFSASVLRSFCETLARTTSLDWKIRGQAEILVEISRLEGIPLDVLVRAIDPG